MRSRCGWRKPSNRNFYDATPLNAMFSVSNRVLLKLSLAVSALVYSSAAWTGEGAGQGNDDIRVSVTRDGDVVRARAQFAVPITAPQAFAVLTDYDRMRDFLPGVMESKVIERSPARLVVSQRARMKVGFVSIPFDSVRQVDLDPPHKLVSRALSGTVSKAQVTTTLQESQGRTLVAYDSEATLSSWMPAGLGASLIQAHIHEQLIHMRAEMLRRRDFFSISK